MLVQATLEFASADTPSGQARSTYIMFEAAGRDSARADVKRWWNNRQENLPEVFTQLYAVSLYMFLPQPIEYDGTLAPSNGLPFLDWKYDRGEPL